MDKAAEADDDDNDVLLVGFLVGAKVDELRTDMMEVVIKCVKWDYYILLYKDYRIRLCIIQKRGCLLLNQFLGLFLFIFPFVLTYSTNVQVFHVILIIP